MADFQPRTVASTETRAALEVFNSVLLNDLKFSAFFDIPSKSFYPLRPLRAPRAVEFENWQVPALDVDFLILGNLQVDVSAGVWKPTFTTSRPGSRSWANGTPFRKQRCCAGWLTSLPIRWCTNFRRGPVAG